MRLAPKFVVLAIATVLLVPAAALADTITGSGPWGSFSAELTYNPTDATLTVELTNTSDPANGGFLTGFAFNNPDDAITGATLTAAPSGWELLFGDIDGDPFGNFDIGAAIDQNFLGGGSPSEGLAAGDTATFEFTFSGTDLSLLTLQDFLDEFSTDGSSSAFFLARFRGFDNGQSDKVPGVPGDAPPIPEPATMLMMGTGLTALAGVIRRRRQAKN